MVGAVRYVSPLAITSEDNYMLFTHWKSTGVAPGVSWEAQIMAPNDAYLIFSELFIEGGSGGD